MSLPAGLTALAMSGAGWSCQARTVTCTLSGGGTLGPGQRDGITLAVAVAGDAPASVPVLLQAAGGGQVPAAGLDTSDLYGVLGNGGAEVDQTSVTPRG